MGKMYAGFFSYLPAVFVCLLKFILFFFSLQLSNGYTDFNFSYVLSK